jgi:hypothetical protein
LLVLLWGFPRSRTSLKEEPPNAGCTAKESEETPEERPIEERSEGNQWAQSELRGDWVNVGEGYNNHNNVGRGTTTTFAGN